VVLRVVVELVLPNNSHVPLAQFKMDTVFAILRPLNHVLGYATPLPQLVLNYQTGLAGGLSAYIPSVGILGDGFTAASLLLSTGGCPSPVLSGLVHTGWTCAMHSIMVGQLVRSASQGRWMADMAGGDKAEAPIRSLFTHRLFNAALIGTAVASVVGITVAAVAGMGPAGKGVTDASCWGEPALLADLASAFFYTVSRLPQVWLNHKRKSGEGLSLGMLSLLAGVNTIKLLGVGASALAAGRLEATPGEMVWIVQGLITVPIDCLMIVQCLRGRGRGRVE